MWQDRNEGAEQKLLAAERKLDEATQRYEAHRSAGHEKLVEAEGQRVAMEATWQRR